MPLKPPKASEALWQLRGELLFFSVTVCKVTGPQTQEAVTVEGNQRTCINDAGDDDDGDDDRSDPADEG